jgi:hypothetical protein
LRFALFFATSFLRCSRRCASPGARVCARFESGGRTGERGRKPHGERGDEKRRWKIPSDVECGSRGPVSRAYLAHRACPAPRRRERSYAGAGDFERHPPLRLALLGCGGGSFSFVPKSQDNR